MAEAGPRVLGVDPGLTRCGLGVLEGPAARPVAVWHGCVTTDAALPPEQRLLQLHDGIRRAIVEHRPEVVAVERVLFSANVRTAMATGQAAGVALLAAAEAGIAVAAYSPNDVKATVAGYGGADKDAVARLVAAQLGLASVPRPVDVTDALAVALTHLARSRIDRLAASTPAATALQEAQAAARQAGRGGWEAVAAARAARGSPDRAASRSTDRATPPTHP